MPTITIELPEPHSRDSELWVDLFMGVFRAEFPFSGDNARPRCEAMVEAFLKRLGDYYERVQSR